MAIKTKLTTSGFEAYLEQIAAAGRNIDADTGEALQAGGAVLADGMHRRAPKDTGNLDQHIGVSATQQDGNFVYVEVGVLDADEETARYGQAQEFGWADHQGAKAGQPYVRPTLDEDMGAARAEMRKVLKARGAV